MADKSFGVKELNLLNASGTPTITSPNNLNLNANNVAISTNVTIGGNLTVSNNIGISSLNVTGVSTFAGITTVSGDTLFTKQLSVTGVITATSFVGNGSGLTGISAGISTSAWTVTNNGASNYVISGPGGLSSANNPDLYLVRGQTYQFIMNAAGHGFGIQTSSGTWNSSNEYTTGITNPRAATGTITFQVPYTAPARLYYACTSQHSGMVGNIYLRGAGGDEANVGDVTFSQTPSSLTGVTVTSQSLDHYEEGTWTPLLTHYFNGSFQPPTGNAGTVNGYYTRIGNVCYINATFSGFSYTNLTVNSFARIAQLPFSASSSSGHISVIKATGTAFSQNNVSFITSGTFLNSKTDDSSWDWAIIDGGTKYLYVSGFYFVD